MRIFLNENEVELNATNSLTELLVAENVMDTNGIAIAINEAVVPKSEWARTRLNENDKIIIITATAGG